MDARMSEGFAAAPFPQGGHGGEGALTLLSRIAGLTREIEACKAERGRGEMLRARIRLAVPYFQKPRRRA